MNGVNKIILTGTLEDDPVSVATSTGKMLATFMLGVAQCASDNEGGQIIRTEYFKIVTYNKVAQACNKMLRKGSKVYVEGSFIHQEVFASDVIFLANYEGGN